jgi:hypothetical protein
MVFNKIVMMFSLIIVSGLMGCVVPAQAPQTPEIASPVDLTVTAIIAAQPTSSQSPTGQRPIPENSGIPGSPEKTTVPTSGVFEPQPTIIHKPSRTPDPVPTSRPGPSVKAAFLAKPPVIDGAWGEWKTELFPVNVLLFGADNWSGKEDLDASFRIGWDYKKLYLAVKVVDDLYIENPTGFDLYKGDSLEIVLDSDLATDYGVGQLNSDDYQLGFSPGSPKPGERPEAYLWFPKLIAGSQPEVKIAAQGGDGSYRVESAIPWSLFGITPRPGMHLGFALRVADNDDPEKDWQQSLVTNVTDSVAGDPTSWGDLWLVEP